MLIMFMFGDKAVIVWHSFHLTYDKTNPKKHMNKCLGWVCEVPFISFHQIETLAETPAVNSANAFLIPSMV